MVDYVQLIRLSDISFTCGSSTARVVVQHEIDDQLNPTWKGSLEIVVNAGGGRVASYVVGAFEYGDDGDAGSITSYNSFWVRVSQERLPSNGRVPNDVFHAVQKAYASVTGSGLAEVDSLEAALAEHRLDSMQSGMYGSGAAQSTIPFPLVPIKIPTQPVDTSTSFKDPGLLRGIIEKYLHGFDRHKQ